MTDVPAPGTVGAIAHESTGHCARAAGALSGSAEEIEESIDAIESADAIRCDASGRSGRPAASLAGPSRHHQGIPDLRWVGDRDWSPFEPGQIFVMLSRLGSAFELAANLFQEEPGIRIGFWCAVTSSDEKRNHVH